MLHGSMRTSRSWDAVARELRHRFHVIAMDARGHGGSDWTPRGYRFSNRVEDAAAFCQRLGLVGLTAVGHSSGAVVLAMLAHQYPELVDRLVLLEGMLSIERDPGPPGPQRPVRSPRTWSTRQELFAHLQGHRTAGSWRADVMLDVVNHETVDLPDGRIGMKWSPDTLNPQESNGDYYDLRPIFRESALPTLFVVSEQRASAFDELKSLAAGVPDFHLSVVSKTGHNMYMERPDAVAHLVTTFARGEAVPGMV